MAFLSSFMCSINTTTPVPGITGSYKGIPVSRCKAWNTIERSSIVQLERHHLKRHIRGVNQRSIFRQNSNTKCLASAASGSPLESDQPSTNKPKSILNSVTNALDAFYRFSRPHTVIGTVKFTFNYIFPVKVQGWLVDLHGLHVYLDCTSELYAFFLLLCFLPLWEKGRNV